jgi:hypothetical protein
MDKILIVFPHGIGDAVMATPAFRALRRKYADAQIDIAVQPLLSSSGFLNHCPYLNTIYTIHNPWCSANYEEGISIVREQVDQLVDLNQYDEVKWVYHHQEKQSKLHKVFLTAKELGVDIGDDTGYEVFLTDEQNMEAMSWLRTRNCSLGNYAFVHIFSSDLRKNISTMEARNLLPTFYQKQAVIVGESFDISEYPVNFAISLLKHAGFTLLVDSVFVHCSDALGKDIDIHITNQAIMETNHPLHIKAHKIIRKKFTKINSLKHRLQKFYHKLQPEFKRAFRNLYYRVQFPTQSDKEAVVNWLEKSISGFNGSSENLVYIVALAVKFVIGQHIINRPYLCYLRKIGASCQFLGSEPVTPVPCKVIEMLKSQKAEYENPLRATIDAIKSAVDKLMSDRLFTRQVWIGRYDVEREKITGSLNVSNGPIRSKIESQQPFVSNEDVMSFFMRVVFPLEWQK